MPPKKIPQSYEKFYDKNTGTLLRPLPLPLPLNREEVARKMELVSERRLQDSQEKSSPSKIFLEEIEKQQKSEKKNKINTRTFENILSDKEEERNKKKEEKRKEREKRLKGLQGLSLLKMRQEINKEKGEKEEEEDYEENEEIRELRKLMGREGGVSLIYDEPYKPKGEKYCDMNNCTIMGGSNDDSPSFTGYFEKYKEIVDSIVNMYNNKKFIEDLKELENYRENVLTDLENPEEIREINANITMIKSLLKIINKNLSNFEELNRVILDKNQKDKLQTKLSGKINFFIAKLEEKELELSDAAINNIKLLNTEEPQSYSAYSDLISQNASDPYAMEDRKVIRKRTTNDGIGGKTKKRKIKKRNKSKKNKRRVSKK